MSKIRRHRVSALTVRRPLAACASLAGSILPHCSQAVNTFAAACQAPVKYCLCSLGPIARQLKAAMKTEPLPDSQYVQYIAKHICSVSNAAQMKIIEGRRRQSEGSGGDRHDAALGWNQMRDIVELIGSTAMAVGIKTKFRSLSSCVHLSARTGPRFNTDQ